MKFFLFIFTFFALVLEFPLFSKTISSPIIKNISYIEDKQGILKFSDTFKQRFITYPNGEKINFGFTSSVYWIKIDLNLSQQTEEKQFWLMIEYPLLEHIDLYAIDSKNHLLKSHRMGTYEPHKSREVASHYFIAKLPSIETKTLYLRVKTQSSMQLPLSVIEADELFSKIEQKNFFTGLYYGLFIIILLFNVVLFIYTTDKNYLRYILFLISFIIWQLSFDGIGIEYIWGDLPWMIQHASSTFIALSSFFALYFSRSFLNTKHYVPKMDTVIVVMMYVSAMMSIFSWFLPYGKIIIFNAGVVSIVPVILLATGLKVMRHDYRAARFYVAGWSSFLIATIIFAFNKFDILPTFYGVNHVQQIGSAIEMIFLSLGLAHKVYLLQREYIDKLNKLNETLSEKVKMSLNEARQKDRLFVQQSRLAAMGEMIEQIAHQWRQPLHTLALINQDMYIKQKLGQADEPFFERHHEHIDANLQYLSKTIDDFRNFYKTDKSKTLEDIGDLAQSALNLSDVFLKYAKIKTNLTITTRSKVYIAKNEMIQVLMNLLKNAHDAIIERNIRYGYVSIHVDEENFIIRVSVEDNAGGISSEIMDQVFDMYFTTKDPDHGTGLGLHMSKYIIEESFGGKIWVENSDIGARFLIELPFEPYKILVTESE